MEWQQIGGVYFCICITCLIIHEWISLQIQWWWRSKQWVLNEGGEVILMMIDYLVQVDVFVDVCLRCVCEEE